MAQPTISMDSIINAFPSFDGKKNYDIENYLTQYETVANEIKIPDSIRVILIKGKFTGQARDAILENDTLNSEVDFKVFKENAIKFFKREYSFERSQADFMQLQQQPDQTIDDFVKKFNTASIKYLNKSGLADQAGAKLFLETIKLPKFLEQIRPDIARDVRKQGPTSFDDAVKIAKNIESALKIESTEEINSLKKSENNTDLYNAILALANTQKENNVALQAEVNALKLHSRQNNEVKKSQLFCEICSIKGHSISSCWYNGRIYKQPNTNNDLRKTENAANAPQDSIMQPSSSQTQHYAPQYYNPIPQYTFQTPQYQYTPQPHWGQTHVSHYSDSRNLDYHTQSPSRQHSNSPQADRNSDTNRPFYRPRQNNRGKQWENSNKDNKNSYSRRWSGNE